MKRNKIVEIVFLLVIFGGIFLLYASTKNYQAYQQTIAEVTEVKQIATEESIDEHGNREEQTQQELKLTIKNGRYLHQELSVTNSYSASQISTQPYQLGNLLFVSINSAPEGQLAAVVSGVKRDHYLVLLLLLFVTILWVVGRGKGSLSLVGLIINSFLLSFSIDYFIDSRSTQLVLFFCLIIPIFTTLSLVLVAGFNRKAVAMISATLLATFSAFLIGWLVMTLLNHQGLRYEEMEFVTRPPHDIFLASLLIGCLGAVMDIVITIASSLYELSEQNPQLKATDLIASGQTIGKDIMGPMVNILLFSYISGAMPLLIVFLRNQLAFQYTFSMILSLEIARGLVGGIGIVLAVPCSIYLITWSLKRKERLV